jgi:hypothetical protein
MNYVIAVLGDRAQAESAYSALEQEGLPMAQVSILGKGYKTADEFGLIDLQQGQKRSLLMSFWLVPFGFIGGYAFNLSTGFTLVDWTGALGNHIIGGLLGAIAGTMGSFFIGSSAGIATDSTYDLPYRTRLGAGKYLIVVNGTASLINTATRVLRQFNPEKIQGYAAPKV